MAKPRTYGEVLELLKIPSNIPKVIQCEMCGEPMHWVQVNSLIGFWIHRGKSIKICGEKNLVNKGYPLIARNMKIYKDIKTLWSFQKKGG